MSEYEVASDFLALPGEANFPPAIAQEVQGGLHIAPECITVLDNKFVLTVWPNGLARHENIRTVRFPHGLMHFGETMEQTARRLVGDQLGLTTDSVRVLEIDSYLDEQNHWHLEPLLLVHVSGELRLPSEAGGIATFSGTDLPEGAVWGHQSFTRVHAAYLSEIGL